MKRLIAIRNCRGLLFATVIMYSIASCTNEDPIVPNQSLNPDSLNSKDNTDSLNFQNKADSLQQQATSDSVAVLYNVDSAFNNSDGKILHAVCYGPFRDGQGPGSDLSDDQIVEDLLIMERHWDAFRLYSSDGNAGKILRVLRQNEIDLKVQLGVWIDGRMPSENARQVNNAITLANMYPDIVQAISCGNEIFGLSFSDIYVSDKNEIIGYIDQIKERTEVQVTINDLYFVWTDDYFSDVVAALDFITIHLYGQWFNIPLENTVPFFNEVVIELRQKYPDKEIVIGETGWTTSKREGQFNPVADEESQKLFYADCQEWSEENSVIVFYFEAFDEPWKGDYEFEAETNWGFYYEDRTPKLVFRMED